MTLVERIKAYIEAVPPAIAGQGGDQQTFDLACRLYQGFALTEEQTLAYLRIYNAKCVPPWSEKELAHKAGQAAKANHQKPRGHLIAAGEDSNQRCSLCQRARPSKPIRTGKIRVYTDQLR